MARQTMSDVGLGFVRDTLLVMARLARLDLVEVKGRPASAVLWLSPEPRQEKPAEGTRAEVRAQAFEQIIQAATRAREDNLRVTGSWVVCATFPDAMFLVEQGEGADVIAAWCEGRVPELRQRDADFRCLEALGQGLVLLDGDGRVEAMSSTASALLDMVPLGEGVDLKARWSELPAMLGSGEVVRGSLERSYPGLGFQAESRHGAEGMLVKVWTHEARGEQRDRQRQFLSTLRHDVRSPLTSLRGLVGVLGDEPEMLPEDRARMVSLLQAEVERMVTWVEDYLVLVGLRHEARPVQTHTLAVALLIEQAEEAFRAHATNRGIVFDVEKTHTIHTVRIDQTLRAPLLKNLIGHMFRLAEVGAVIRIKVGARGELIVEGGGPGLFATQYGEPFGTLSRSTASGKRTPGVGLGLYLVRKIADLHGWHICCERSEGRMRVTIDWAERLAAGV